MKLKLIPVSKAKTALGLLGDVKRAILQEPKRADMTTYTDRIHPEEGGPACGTVGCVAGWISLLAGQGYVDDAAPAKKLLGYGLNYYTVGENDYVFNEGYGDDCVITDPGTPEHAEAVVDRILVKVGTLQGDE